MAATGFCSAIVTDPNSITDPTNLLGNTTERSYGTYVITWCQENHHHDGPEYIHCAPGGWVPSVPVCRGSSNLNEVEVEQDPWAYIVLGIIGALLLIFFMIAIIIIARHKRKQRKYKGLGKKHKSRWAVIAPPGWLGRARRESYSTTSSEKADHHVTYPNSKDKAGSYGDPRLDPTMVGRPWIHTIDRGDETVDRHGNPSPQYADDTYWNRYNNTYFGQGISNSRPDNQLEASTLKPAVRAHSDYTPGYFGVGRGDFRQGSGDHRHNEKNHKKQNKRNKKEIVTGTWMQRYRNWYDSNISHKGTSKDSFERHSAPPAPMPVAEERTDVHRSVSPYPGRRIVTTEYFTEGMDPGRAYYESRVPMGE